MIPVNRMKLNTDTLFVGEPTASSPNHFGDDAPVVLPNSKLIVRLATLWWQEMGSDDTRLWQAPDLAADLTFADYRSGHDRAMELILRYEPGPSIATSKNQCIPEHSMEQLASKLCATMLHLRGPE